MKINLYTTPNNFNKIKKNIIDELIRKTSFEEACEYAKINIHIIQRHQSILFTNGMTNSLQYAILHLANLNFGFKVHDASELSYVFKELFGILPNSMETKQLQYIYINIKKSKYTKYDNVINDNLDKIKTITFANKNKFSGKIKNGLYNYGELVNQNGSRFEGEFFLGGACSDGKIIFKYENGDTYEGQWKDGLKHGNGKFTWEDGGAYEGQWKDGLMHGNGKYTFKSGNTYEGQFENEKRHGNGKYTFKEGDTYEGGYKNDKKHGNGKYTFKEGDTYEGGYKNNKRHGNGKYTWKDGTAYEGQWKDGLKHGNGKYTFKEGDTIEGQFENNILTDIDKKFLSNFMWTMFKHRSGQLYGGFQGATNIFFKNIFKNINESSLYNNNFKKFIKNIKSKEEEIHKNLLFPNDLMNKFDNLKNDQSLVFDPMLSGHCIILECILISNNKIKVSIYNSGDGLQYHEKKTITKYLTTKTKHQTRKNFVFDKTIFVEKIIPLINKDTTVNDFYKTLLSYSNKTPSIHLLNKIIWQKSQVGGNCSIESHMAYFKNLGGDIVYNQFQLQMLDILKNKYSIDNNNLLIKELKKRHEKITEKIGNLQTIRKSSEHV